MKRFSAIIFILSFVWVYYGGQAAGDEQSLTGDEKIYRLGVQIDTSREECLKKWQPLADYLTKNVEGCSFKLIPLKIDVISYAIENGDIDFVLCNPAFFVLFCEQRDASQLVTRINNDTGQPLNRYAGVIFCRAENESIYSIHDLKGKVFVHPNTFSLGGWLAVWREMLAQGFDPKKELKELQTAPTQYNVIMKVLSGNADAGSVRSDILVMMAKKGLINLDNLRIINRKKDDFPLPHSTECYPEWGFTKLDHINEKVSKDVTITLLQMKPNDPAAVAAEIAGWSPPENYHEIVECLKELHIDRYATPHKFSWTSCIWQHRPIFTAFVIFILAAGGAVFFSLRSRWKYRRRIKDLTVRHDRLTTILNNIREGFAYCNNRDEFIYVNKSFCSLTGFDPENLLAINILSRLPADICRAAVKVLGEYRRNIYAEPYEMTYCLNNVDVFVRIIPFYANNKYEGALFCIADIKELVFARKETATLNRELEESIRRYNRLAAKSLRDAKSKTVILSRLNRDIRTPLSGIIGLINILENTELQSQQKNYVDILKNTTETLIALLDKALDISRLETQEVKLERILFDIRDEVSQAVAFFQFRAQEKGLTLGCTVDDDVPQKICNAPDRLRQILINLLSNSVRCTDKGKVNLRVTLSDSTENEDTIEFIVSDTGMGISPEKLKKLFDEVHPREDSFNVHSGTGIGLAISRKIARLMGGELVAESSPGIGSTFTLTIQDFHAESSDDEPQEEHLVTTANAVDMLMGLNVLIAEDNQVNRLVLDQILAKQGCKVTCVENGRDAVEEIKNGSFDLVLMDCHMPILDGFEATLEIRRLAPPKCNLPILAITANALPQIKDFCFRCGMDGYISKPFSAENLKLAILHCLTGIGEIAGTKSRPSKSGNATIDVDQQALAERIGKSGDVMKRVVKLFIEDCVKSMEQLRQCFNDNDMEQAAKVAHSLKGSSALAGATRIQNAAMEAEQAAMDCDREYLGKVIEIIEECFKKYKSAVATCI